MIEPEFLDKQLIALDYLANTSDCESILYGGSAGSGKTRLGCTWQILRRLKYAGTRSVIGRSKLDTLKKTTLKTFLDVAKDLGLKAGKHYTLNQQSNTIIFFNESEIILKDMFAYPSDPDFDDLGSLEITDYFLDEIGEIVEKAQTVLHTRVRYKLTYFCRDCSAGGLDQGEVTRYELIEETGKQKAVEWLCKSCGNKSRGLIPKGLGTCNPCKGYVYNEYYLKAKNNELPSHRAFVQALPTDNHHLPESYLESLRRLPEYDRKRLYEGNWEFDDDSDKLFNTFNLNQMFRNEIVGDGTFYITGDIARFGRDKTILIVWNGWTIVEMVELVRSGIVETSTRIQELVKQYNVRLSNVLLDEDGVGGGAVDITKARGFMNGSKAVHSDKYVNLKTECYYKLAEVIENGKLSILAASNKERIIKELETIKRYRSDADSKNRVTPKEEIKRIHGFSPDIADSMMMRAYFDLKPNRGNYVLLGSK